METLTTISALIGAAICMGMGAIGAAAGCGYTAYKAAEATTRQPQAKDEILRTMLIGMAVAESPGIFALFIAIILAMTPASEISLIHLCGLFSAGVCMGLGALGPGLGAGYAAGKGCEGVGRQPGNSTLLMRTMLIGQAVSQSTSIYALFVAMLLIYVVGG